MRRSSPPKRKSTETLLERIPEALMFAPEYLAMTQSILGDDPFPYGMKANQAMLDTIISYSHEQGLTPRKMKNEELFAAETWIRNLNVGGERPCRAITDASSRRRQPSKSISPKTLRRQHAET